MNHTSQLQSLLNEREVSTIIGMSLPSVRRWRLLKQGPKYLKIGAAVRYRREDLIEWLASRPSGGGCEPGGTR